jgi:hypothetical protein
MLAWVCTSATVALDFIFALFYFSSLPQNYNDHNDDDADFRYQKKAFRDEIHHIGLLLYV